MMEIDYDTVNSLYSYYEKNYDIDDLVDYLADILEKNTGFEVVIYQDYDDDNYYRLYASSSAVEVYLDDDILCIDFDDTWAIKDNSYVNVTYKGQKV